MQLFSFRATITALVSYYGVHQIVDALLPYKKEYGNITVNPHNFSFIQQPEPCQKENTVLVTVHSAPQNVRRRMTLRNTWSNPRLLERYLPQGYSSKLVFILGLSATGDNQASILYESEAYRDLLQVNFIDNYKNNTYKAIYNMKWISSYSGCSKAKLVIKIDDDVMFNLKNFRSFWKDFTGQLKSNNSDFEALFMSGNLFKGEPIREPSDKWYMPREVYKYDTFPYWFQGMVYFLSPRLAKKIYELSFTTPYMFTDDAYVGIVADRVEKLRRFDLSKYYVNAFTGIMAQRTYWKKRAEMFYHSHSIDDAYELWWIFCDFNKCVGT